MKFPIIILAVAVCLGSCQQQEKERGRPHLTLTDDLGHVVSIPHTPRRIISLAPSITETLFALGLDSSIAGVTDYCDYPEAAKRKPRVGGILNPNIERILALQPDLVLMTGSGNMRSDYDKLTAAGVKAFVSYPKTINDIFKSISDIGVLTSRQTAADSIVHILMNRRDDLARRAAAEPRQTVLMLVSVNPIVAIGAGTFLDELLSLAHGENIAHGSSTSYPLLSREEILRRQPDVIIATNDIVHSAADILSAYPEWSSLSAIRNNRVAVVDANLVSRPGPRIIDGLESIITAIHPAR